MANLARSQVANWRRRLSKEYRKEISVEIVGADEPNDHLTEVLGVEDIIFHIATYLVPKRNPSSMQEMMSNLLFVSRHWHKSFSLVRAQMRHDFLMKHLSTNDNDGDWLYHKIIYLPGPERGRRPIPPEGCLRIFRSRVNDACKEAMHEYRSNRNNDEHLDDGRTDSRPDYYYKAHRENATCLELVPPKELSCWAGSMVNEIEYDQKPRLICQYYMTIDDVNGLECPSASDKSKEGRVDLGYHEIISVRDSLNARLNPRPQLNQPGEDTTNFLKSCNAKAHDAPRWVRFAHVVGEDRCKMFLHKSLLPMIGSRPTGNTWHVPSSPNS